MLQEQIVQAAFCWTKGETSLDLPGLHKKPYYVSSLTDGEAGYSALWTGVAIHVGTGGGPFVVMVIQ